MSLSKNLRSILQKKGISINALERTAGVKPGSVQNILYGRSKNPGIETLLAIANALNIDLSELRSDVYLVSPSSTDWDMNLYAKTLETICKIMNEEAFVSNKRDFFDCVENVYEYSKKNSKDRVDYTFAKWFLREKFQKKAS